MDLLRALSLNDGAARRSHLLEMGVPERSIARAVREGVVMRYAPGCYSFATTPVAVQRAVQFRARIGCLTACEGAGLPLWDVPRLPHLVVPQSRSASRRPPAAAALAVVHRVDRTESGALWASASQAIDQASRCCTPLAHLVVIEAALRTGLIDRAQLDTMTLGNARRRDWLQTWSSARSESPLESVARAGFVCAGLEVEQQVEFTGVGRVDMVVEGALVVEADGWEYHADRKAFENDRERDGASLEIGVPVMRVTARMLRGNLAGVVNRVAAIVGRAPRARFDESLEWLHGSPAHSVRWSSTHSIADGPSCEHPGIRWVA